MGSYIEEFQNSDREKESDIVITVDGPAGAGKGTIAEHIAQRLGIEHFSASDVFYQVAEERGLEDHELSEEAEKEIDLEIDRRTLERGLKKSCVIDGRLPSWALGDYSDLRIYVEADLSERAKRTAERDGYDPEEAEEIVEKRDTEDYQRYEDYYGINPEERDIYDIIMDNTELSIEEQNQLVDEILEKLFPERFN